MYFENDRMQFIKLLKNIFGNQCTVGKNISIHDLKKKSWCWVKNVTIGSKKVIIMSIMEDIFCGIEIKKRKFRASLG